ncbi:MAG: ATP-dependent helicase [Spirochaetales bacterium]|nr:ATP-dependent helicase [Candidatus Physcosoma equi]
MIDLSSLNKEQMEAVEDFDNNLLILACAGSGKTKTITSKIAYAIETGRVYPSQICAVTFTNRAAKEMRDRVAALLPDVDTSRMVLRTFHSLGASLLRRFATSMGLSPDFSIYDDDDSFQVLCGVSSLDRKVLRQFQKSISKAKDLGFDPDSDKLNEINDHPAFRDTFRAYNRELEKTGNVDFADLIQKAEELLKTNPEAKGYCHNRFRMILVDEYQDSNKEQFQFLRLFKGEDAQLIVVGDDDQSIYSFRGAEIKNILTFSSQFQKVREIKLEKNYRSTDEILAPAGELIRHNKDRHVKDIVSADGKHGQKPMVLCSMTGKMEAQRIANIIRGIGDYNNTAVLYRTNAQSLAFEQEFTQHRIPYKVIGALKFYEREEVKDALSFLRLLMNHRDEVSFKRIINKPSRGIGDKKVEKILSLGDDIYDGLAQFALETKGEAGESARLFLRGWKTAEDALDQNENLGNVLYKALQNIQLIDHYQAEPDKAVRQAKLDNLGQLVNVLSGAEDEEDNIFADEIDLEKSEEEFCGRNALRSFLEKLTLDSTVLGDDDPRDQQGVTLITMHNTKGLEYDRVFCAGLEEDIIPGRNADEPEKKEEERRILYVAMTRARKSLYLSYATSRMMWGHTNNTMASSFLRDIPSALLSGDVDAIRSRSSFGSSFGSTYGQKSGFFGSSYGTSSYTQKTQTSVSNTPSWASKVAGLGGTGFSSGNTASSYGSSSSNSSKPKSVAAINSSQSGFAVGDRVKKDNYGEGTIDNVEVRPDKRILTVTFDSGRKMKFVDGHSGLEKA